MIEKKLKMNNSAVYVIPNDRFGLEESLFLSVPNHSLSLPNVGDSVFFSENMDGKFKVIDRHFLPRTGIVFIYLRIESWPIGAILALYKFGFEKAKQ